MRSSCDHDSRPRSSFLASCSRNRRTRARLRPPHDATRPCLRRGALDVEAASRSACAPTWRTPPDGVRLASDRVQVSPVESGPQRLQLPARRRGTLRGSPRPRRGPRPAGPGGPPDRRPRSHAPACPAPRPPRPPPRPRRRPLAPSARERRRACPAAGLGEVVVHAGGKAGRPVLRPRVRGQRDDGHDGRARPSPGRGHPRGLQPVQPGICTSMSTRSNGAVPSASSAAWPFATASAR